MMAGIVLAALALVTAATEPHAKGPQWERSLVAPADSAPLGRIVLDSPIYAHTRDDFADLRIHDRENRPVGIHVRPVVGQDLHCEERPVPMRRLDMRVLGDSAFEAVFLSEDPERIPDRVAVSVDAVDFEISLSLWTAASALKDGRPTAPWIPRLQGAPLFDYSRFVDLRRADAEWHPDTNHRALRLRVDGLTQSQRTLLSTLSGKVGLPSAESFQVERRLLRMESITFSGQICAKRQVGVLLDTLNLSADGFAKPVWEAKAKRSWFIFSPGRHSLQALMLQVGPRNFMRSAILVGWPDSVITSRDSSARPWSWPRLAEARIHRIDWGGKLDSSLRISLSGPGRFATLALGISDNDDMPIELKGIKAEVERLEALFPTQGRDTLFLRYGDADPGPLNLDFQSMLQRAPGSRVATFIPGPAHPYLGPKEPEPARPWISGDMLLNGGIALAIGALMVLLFLVARKAGKER